MQLLILAWIALTARFAAVQADDNRQLADDILIPRRYIVEFSDPDGLRKRAPPDGNVSSPHRPSLVITQLIVLQHYSVFYNHLADNGIDANPCMNLTSTVFEGASFTADTNLNDLLALSQVKNVWPVERYDYECLTR